MGEGVAYGNLPFSDMDYPESNIDHDYWIWNYTPLPNIFSAFGPHASWTPNS